MSDNHFGDAMDDAADEQTNENSGDDFDVDAHLDALGDGPKDKTIGLATDERTHRFFHELADAEEVDVDVRESLRSHLEKLANRHPEVFERAMRKLEIDQKY